MIFVIAAVAVYAAVVLNFYWPWDWAGKRRSLKLRRAKRPWE